MRPPPNDKKRRDPSLWWLDFEFDGASYVHPLSMVKVQDFWIMVTDHSVLKFTYDPTGESDIQPRVIVLCEF